MYSRASMPTVKAPVSESNLATIFSTISLHNFPLPAYCKIFFNFSAATVFCQLPFFIFWWLIVRGDCKLTLGLGDSYCSWLRGDSDVWVHLTQNGNYCGQSARLKIIWLWEIQIGTIDHCKYWISLLQFQPNRPHSPMGERNHTA